MVTSVAFTEVGLVGRSMPWMVSHNGSRALWGWWTVNSTCRDHPPVGVVGEGDEGNGSSSPTL